MGNIQAKFLQAQLQRLVKVWPKRCDEIGVTDIIDMTQNPEAKCAVCTWLNKYAAHLTSPQAFGLKSDNTKKSYKTKVISLLN